MLLGMRQGPFGDPSPVINWDFLQSQSLTSFSRTSNATLFDSTGKLTYAANNLLTQSNTFNAGSWTAPAVTLTSGQTDPFSGSSAWLVYPASTGNREVYVSFTYVTGVKYILSLYVKPNNKQWMFLGTNGGTNGSCVWFDLTNGVVGNQGTGHVGSIVSVGSGWYRISVAVTGGATGVSSYFDFGPCDANGSGSITTSGTNGIYAYGAQLEAVTYQTTPSTYVATTANPYYGPRYPYAYNGTTWDAQGLLVEAAATNLCQYSQDMRAVSGWNNNAATVNINVSATLAPDGTQTANKIIEGGSTTLQVYRSFTVTTAAYTYSCFAKAAERSWLIVYAQDAATDPAAWFNLSNGTVGTQQAGVTASIQNVGGGWYRCCVTRVAASAGTGYIKVRPAIADNNASNTGANDGVTGIYVWGAQVEAGDLSSYIPNLSTGTATRNADTSLAFSALSLPTGLSFSRTSNAMQYDAAGRLTYAPNNILTYSNTFTNTSAWNTFGGSTRALDTSVLAPDGSQTAYKIVFTGANQVLGHAVGAVDGTKILSCWVKGTAGETIAISDEVATAQVYTLTGNWQQIYVVSNSATINPGIDTYNSTTARTIWVWNYVVARVTYETVARPCDQIITTTDPYYGPRYDYDPVTRLPKGLLVEEARTNVATNSATFSGWSTNAASIATDASIVAPDGSAAIKISNTTTTPADYPLIYLPYTSTAAAYTQSIYAKAGSVKFLSVATYDGTSVKFSGVNLLTGAADITAPGHALTATSVGNGWWRVSLVYTYPSTTGRIYAGLYKTSGSPSYTPSAVGSDYIYIYGAQVELGSFPTSYIPTAASSVQRTADVATVTGANFSSFWNATEGTLYVRASSNGWNSSGVQYLASANDTAAGNQAVNLLSNLVGNAQFRVWSSGSITGNITGTRQQLGQLSKYAGAYKIDNFGFSVAGGTAGTDPTGGLPSGVIQLELGAAAASSYLNGHIAAFKYWRVRLSNAKLQTETA